MTVLALDREALAAVLGGASAPNITSYKGNDGSTAYTARTDYAYCVDAVKQNCAAANPGLLWGTNEKGAAQCTLDNLPKACPPSLSGGTDAGSPTSP